MEKISQALEIFYRQPQIILTFALISAIPNILTHLGVLPFEWTNNLVLTIIGSIGVLLLSSVVAGAQILVFSRAYDNEPASLGEALTFALGKWLPLVGIALAYSLIIVLGMLLCIIPGIIFAIEYGFAAILVAVEDRKIGDALTRSSKLTQGRRMDMFLTTFMAAVPMIIVQVFFFGLGPELGFASEPIPLVGLEFLNHLTWVFGGIIVFCFYRDAIRTEREIYETDYVLAEAQATAPSPIPPIQE